MQTRCLNSIKASKKTGEQRGFHSDLGISARHPQQFICGNAWRLQRDDEERACTNGNVTWKHPLKDKKIPRFLKNFKDKPDIRNDNSFISPPQFLQLEKKEKNVGIVGIGNILEQFRAGKQNVKELTQFRWTCGGRLSSSFIKFACTTKPTLTE